MAQILENKYDSVSYFEIIANCLFTTVLCYWGVILLTKKPIPTIPLDYANDLIHEYSGALFLLSYNQVIIALGQNITQVVIPLFPVPSPDNPLK